MARQDALGYLKYFCWRRVQRLCVPKGCHGKLREIVEKFSEIVEKAYNAKSRHSLI